jgi:hypothetical protein
LNVDVPLSRSGISKSGYGFPDLDLEVPNELAGW